MGHECGCCDGVPGWIYHWHCVGCRSRWLATLPTREWRQHAIQQWRSAGEGAMVAAVIAKLKEMANG